MKVGEAVLDRGNVRDCYRCGAAGSVCEVSHNGDVVAIGALCDACWDDVTAENARLRQEYEALLEAGLSREAANARMIEKIEGRNATA